MPGMTPRCRFPIRSGMTVCLEIPGQAGNDEKLIIFRLELEVALGVVTDGADRGSFLADDDVAAVGALPDAVALAGEHDGVLDVLEELAVALLVLFLDLAHHAELGSNLLEALFLRFLGHAGVHVRPLVVLAGSGVGQVLGSRGHAVVEVLEPYLRVLLLVGRGLLEDLGDLHVAVLLGLGCVVGVLVASHGLAGESLLEVLFGLGSFEVHNWVDDGIDISFTPRSFE